MLNVVAPLIRLRMLFVIRLIRRFRSELRIVIAGVNPKKLFTDVIYKFSLSARAFVPGKRFRPSQMFVSKVFPPNIRLGRKGLPVTNALCKLWL
jgi:hypothetical protein